MDTVRVATATSTRALAKLSVKVLPRGVMEICARVVSMLATAAMLGMDMDGLSLGTVLGTLLGTMVGTVVRTLGLQTEAGVPTAAVKEVNHSESSVFLLQCGI